MLSKIYPPDWELVGVQVNAPVSLLIVAPLGCLSSEYYSFSI